MILDLLTSSSNIQKNKTNSLLTSSQGNGCWEKPIKSKYIERVLKSRECIMIAKDQASECVEGIGKRCFGPCCKQYKRHNKK